MEVTGCAVWGGFCCILCPSQPMDVCRSSYVNVLLYPIKIFFSKIFKVVKLLKYLSLHSSCGLTLATLQGLDSLELSKILWVFSLFHYICEKVACRRESLNLC